MNPVQTAPPGGEGVLARYGAFLPACVLASLSAAVYNGFPLMYSDTGTYLASAATLDPPLDRPIFYSLFLRAVLAPGRSLWWPIVAQALILGWLLRLLIDHVRPDIRTRRAAGLILGLAAGTGLPWICGQLMPDIFTGCLAIAFYLLVYHAPSLGRAKAPLALVFVSCLFVHTSNIAITALLLGLLSISAVLRPRLLAPAALFAATLVAIPAANRLCSGKFSLSSWGHNFLMIRLTEDRIVERLLRDRCSQRRYALCAYQDPMKTMVGERYLFDPASPMDQIGGWEGTAGVTWPIIADAWLYYPAQNLKSLAAGFFLQLFGFSGTLSALDQSSFVFHAIEKHFPEHLEDFERARQATGALTRALEPLHALHWLLALVALLMLTASALAPRLASIQSADELARFMVLFFGANAAVCSAMSHFSARFQWRIAWLLVFCAALKAPELRKLLSVRDPTQGNAPPGAAEEQRARKGRKVPPAPAEGVTPWRATGLATGLAVALFAASMAAAFIVSRNCVLTEPSLYSYVDEPVVTWPRPDRFERRIPRSTLGNPAGLQAGVTMKAHTVSGREFIGIVAAVGDTDVTLGYSWETVRWALTNRGPTRTVRRLPLAAFPPGIEIKPGSPVEGFAKGTITAVDRDEVTVEFGASERTAR